MSNKQQNLHKRAQALFTTNRLKEAQVIYKKLCHLNNNDIQAWHMAGAIAGMTGDNATAKSCCEKVIALNPRNHAPHLNLANVLLASGNLQGALQHYQQALQLKPGDPQTLTNLANLYTRQGQPQPAENCLQKAIRSNPDFPEAYNSLGNLYRDTGRWQDAETCFHQALKINPCYVDALCNLGAVFSDQLKFVEAEGCYNRALQYAPNTLAALRNLGDLYQSTGEFEQAKKSYEKALKQSPADNRTISSLATLYERCNDKEHALGLLTPLINSGHYEASSAISYAKLRHQQGDSEAGIQLLLATLKRHTSPNNATDIHFALGELYDHCQQYKQAFSCFKKANDLDAARQPTKMHVAKLTPVAEFFSQQRLDTLPRSTCHSELPVFIVGMPRTGTSLVEQILASHPQVSAGGERGDIFTIIDALKSTRAPTKSFPQSLELTSPQTLNEIADSHLQQIEPLAHGCNRFTDKTPLQGMLLGFINRLLPNSRVIICNRNALDTCLSIYFHRFNAFHGYANQLDSLGTFHKEYYALMQHWVENLDMNILSLQYEDLVQEPEQQIRSLIDFCGLDWDDNCLLFHKNKRTLNTPSYDQVRMPIYTKSIARWKHYNEYLEPLISALDK